MLNIKMVKKKILIILLTTVCLFCIIPVIPVAAQDPVVLVIGSEGTTPWNVSNIVPGDSGTKNTTVRNNGSSAGNLYIWITNIVDLEGLNPESETGDTDEPGELSEHMLFSVSSSRLTTNIVMPSVLQNFPHNRSDSRYIKVLSLNPGETVSLTWDWELPYSTGNVVQGDILSFDIKYTLEEIVSTTTTTTSETTTTTSPTTTTTTTSPIITTTQTSTTQTVTTTSETTNETTDTTTETTTDTTTETTTDTTTETTTEITVTTTNGKKKIMVGFSDSGTSEFDIGDDGIVHHDIDLTSPDGTLSLFIPEGTTALDTLGEPLQQLIGSVFEDPPPPPQDSKMIGLAYEFLGDGATFNPPLTLKFYYKDSDISEGVNEEDLYVAYYDDNKGEWIALECDVDTENNVITAYISHFTIYSIIMPEGSPPIVISNFNKILMILLGSQLVVLTAAALYFVKYRKRKRQKRADSFQNI